MSIKPVSSTMGKASPASVASGTGYYRYRGNQPEQEHGERDPLPQNRIATAAKRERMATFTRLRLEGKSKNEAAAEIGISASTAAYYERDFKEQQRRESLDG